jgi:protein gp37
MGAKTAIAWTDHTFNPWWGCNKVSPGCDYCYAATFANGRGGYTGKTDARPVIWGPPRETTRRLFGPKHWREPLEWNAAAAQRGIRERVFCASMADVFEWHPLLDDARAQLWELIDRTPWLDWQLLTKRPMNIARMLPAAWLGRPRQNVWLGTSAETQVWADLRIPRLLEVPAVVHFVSAEPLLDDVDLRAYLGPDRVNWVITGGESGPRHRPFDVAWVREINAQCSSAGAAHFFKQHGGRTHAEGGCLLDGCEVKEFPRSRLVAA